MGRRNKLSRAESTDGQDCLTLDKAFELFRSSRVAQFPKRFCFDLPNAFSRYGELPPDFFKRMVGIHIDAKTHTEHLGFAFRERG